MSATGAPLAVLESRMRVSPEWAVTMLKAESGCQKDMADLGYHVTYFDVDTGKVYWILH